MSGCTYIKLVLIIRNFNKLIIYMRKDCTLTDGALEDIFFFIYFSKLDVTVQGSINTAIKICTIR